MTNQLQYTVDRLVALRTKRLELEKIAAEIKKEEENVKASIITDLNALGMRGAKLPNGTVGLRTTKRIIVSDKERACQYAYNRMKLAVEEGRPLSDEFVFQSTPHKGTVTDILLERFGVDDLDKINLDVLMTAASEMGMHLDLKTDVTFTAKK